MIYELTKTNSMNSHYSNQGLRKKDFRTFVLVNVRTLSPTVTLKGSLVTSDSFTPTDPVAHVDLIEGLTRSVTEPKCASVPQ